MKQSLTLSIPAQLPPGEGAFDTHPAAVDAWLATLPMDNRGEATRQLYKTLHEVNRLEIPLKHRFELLERFGQPLHPILESLRKHYSSGEFPLSEKAQGVARLATELLSEVIIGYRIILDGEASSSWLFRKSHKSMWIISVHRLFCSFSQIMDNYRLLNMPPPEGIWQEIHRMFTGIEKLGWSRERIVPHRGEGEATTIIDEYRHTLLLSLVNYNYLRPLEIESVKRSIPYWGKLIRLQSASDASGAFFAISFERDMPPASLDADKLPPQEKANLLQLDTSPLLKEIEEKVEALTGDTLTLEGNIHLGRDTLELLAKQWTPVSRRRAERQFRNESLMVVAGLDAVNAMFRQSDADETTESDAMEGEATIAPISMKGDDRESAADFTMLASQDEEGDVWNQVYIAKERKQQQEKHWTELGKAAPVTVTELSAKVINFSQTGYCLQIPADNRQRIRVGDLIALQRPNEKEWLLAALRWIQQGGESSLLLGVELFASHVLPSRLLFDGDPGSRPVDALVAIDRDSELALVLPRLPGIRKKKLLLDYEGYTTGLKLLKRWLISPGFEVYRFKDMKAKGEVPGAMEALKQQQRTEQAKRAVDDNGDPLWIEFE